MSASRLLKVANVLNMSADKLSLKLYPLKASCNQLYYFFQQINEEVFHSKCSMSCYYMSVGQAAIFAYGLDKNGPTQGVK